MITMGIEGGPRDGQTVDVEADGEGRPPERWETNGAVYLARPFGIAPHEAAGWHYCHRTERQR